MIRIGTNRCGYTGYTCRGIPQLHGSHETVIEGTTITVQHMFNEANELVSAMRQEFDKLPLRIKGMVFAADTINMGWPEGGPHPEVPEISCRYDTDPFSISKKVAEQSSQIAVAISGQTYQYPVFGSTNGWVDLFNACDVAGGTDGYCYRRDVFLEKTLDTEEGGITVKGHTLALVDNIPAFVSGNTEYIMGPGLLEPMLDTDFDPIDIDTIPAWEAGDDSFIFTTTVLGAWKEVVDDRFRNVYARLNNIPVAATDYNLRDLKREEYENTDCQNFRINLSSGDSLQTRGNQVANLYTVTDGQVAVDDYSVYVSGDVFTVEPAVEYPIYVWVRVYETDGTGETTTAEIILLDDSYSIGDELSGGEVIAKEQISVPGSVYRYKYTVQFDDGRKYTGLLFFGFPLPDADDHVVVVGGVRKVFGGTDDDSFVLFKIFQTECSPVMNFASDAETGLHGVIDFDVDGNEIITPLPGSTVTPAPGIVQPAVNIALVVNGSTETNTQSTTDVPTVEAVYNFIHGITAYNGPVADAKATEVELSGISGSTVFGEPVDYVIPINKDRWAQNTEDEISGYTAAASMYEAAKAAWELAGEPTEGEIYEAYIEASTVYSDAYYTVYGDVSDGEPGTTYVINNIVLMNGDMMGVAATTAPSVRAVYNFVHDIYALSKAGTILVNEQNVPYVKHGTPGTVFTIDSLDKARYEAEEYYQDEVPTVKAVMDYVKMEGATSSTVGIIGYTTNQPEVLWPIPGSTVSPSEGYVQNVRNIYVSGTHSVSGYAVPTVDAVYNFIHNVAVEGMTFSSALVTGGTLAEITTTAEDVTTVTGYTATGEPGTCYMATAIPVGSTVSIGLDNCAPTVQAVIDYVGAMDVDAVAGTLINGSTTEEWAVGPSYTDPVRGTVEVSSQIVVGATPGLSLQTVPSVKSVYDFVHSSSVDDAYKALATGGTVGNAYPSDTWKLHSVPGSTPTCYTFYRNRYSVVQVEPGQPMHVVATVGNATPGTLYVIDTIVNNGASNADVKILTAADPETTVPSVTAVYDFVHNMWALAVPGTPGETTEGSLTVKIIKHGIPGTVFTVDTVDTQYLNKGISGYYYDEVPTVRAVIDYVEGRPCKGSTAGIIAVPGGTESLVSVQGTTAEAGIVQPVKNINIGTQDPNAVSPTAVPTVEAVYNFIHGTTITGYGVADAKATAGVMGSTTGAQSVQGTTVTGAVPGTYNVVKNIVTIQNGTVSTRGGTTAQKYVPEAQAVVDWTTAFVADYKAVGGTIYLHDTDGEKWVDAGTVFTGIVTVSDNIEVAADKTKRNLSPNSVPTVEAVYLYVADKIPGNAKEGYIKVAGGTESLAWATGSTAYPGLVQTVMNISTGTQDPNAVSPSAVPTVQAVIDYIHGSTVEGYDTDDSRATASVTEAVEGSTTAVKLAEGAERGTFFVTSDIQAISDTVTVYNDPQTVPTTMAVVDYMRSYVARQTAVAGVITVTGTGSAQKENLEPAVTGTTAKAGLVQYVRNILVGGTHGISSYTVPTVEAVDCYIHGKTINGMVFSSARATAGIMEVVVGQTVNLINSTPGTFDVVDKIETTIVEVGGATALVTAANCVPTAEAVVAYVKKAEAGVDDAVTNVITQEVAYGTVSEFSGVPGIVDIYDNIFFVTSGNVTSIYGGTAGVPTLTAVDRYLHGIYARATIGGTTATVEGATAYGCTPGTFDVVSNIDASTVSGVVTSANDVVPTADAVAKYVQSHTPVIPSTPDSQSGILVVDSDDAEDWDEDYIPVPGIVRVSREINVSVSNRSISLQAVPSLSAVADYVAGYTASIGGFTVTGADAEDWSRSGDPVIARKAIPGIVGVVDTLVAAATVSNRTLSISTVPTVAAVKDYVDEHIPGAPVSGQLDFNGNFVNGTTVTAGIVKISTNVKGGAAGSDARTAVPTADAVYTFVSGYQAVIGLLYAPEDDTEEWQSDHTGTSGMITVVGNMDVAPDSDNRTISKYSVPTADAVYDFVHGLVTGATAGTMEEETPEDSPTVEACTGAVSGIVLVARNVWLLDDYADRTVSNQAVPTVEAVYNFIRGYTVNYAGGASYPVANILAIPGRLGVGADGTRDSWLPGTDYAPIQGVVQTAGNIVAGSTAGASTTAVPTVRSIYNFVHSKSTFTPGRALATGSTITAPAQGTTIATYAAGGTPGTCYVCEDMEGLYGSTVTLSPTYGTYSLASVVPTVEAVKNYVAAHGGTSGGAYTGYFAADENGIADGIAIFGSTVINVTGSTTALTGTQSAWAVIWKNDNGSWGGTVGTTYSTGIKKVSYLIARRVNNEIKQVQYGGISIEGRWG